MKLLAAGVAACLLLLITVVATNGPSSPAPYVPPGFSSNAAAIGGLGGRMLGHARACGATIDSTAGFRATIEGAVDRRTNNPGERAYARELLTLAADAGAAEISSGRVSCPEAIAAMAQLLVTLKRQ